MKMKPAFLILSLTLITVPLLPGTVSAHGGGDRDHHSGWDHRGHDDRGHDHRGHHGHGWGDHGHHNGWHGKGFREPEVVYRVRPVVPMPVVPALGLDGLTIIYNGRFH